ncbi:Bardet-Biedl syndrome 12 protein homolog isoform X2 [Acropora muricata]|uniref:Bardet-Biedl syndrome 12 protein homolog isoform X2 n=1 Tax=Acropora muricata TaxID=159855 RepID=UPI0034E5A7DD
MADEFREFITSQNSNNLLVARAVASSVKTLLGPQHSLKCVLSEEDAVMCSSTSKLLQFIDIQHPAGFIINDVCQGQFKKFRTNCKTLVCMTGFWSKAAQDLQYQGIPVPVIVQLFEEALSMCEEILQELSLPVITALQNHTAAEHFEAEIIADKGAFTVCESHVLKDESKEFRSSDYDDCNASGNDGDGDGDISWYFASPDGHIPGVHDQMPGTNHQIPGVYELSGISPTAKPAAIIDQSFSSVALLDESWQQERKGYEETEDRTLTVGKTREMTINTRVHKTEKFKQNEKDEKDCRQFALSSLRSKLVDDEDEFEASFLDASVRFNQDVAQPSNQEFLYTKLPMGEKEGICNTLTKDRLLSSVFVQERDNNRKNVKNKTSSCFETEPSKTCLGSKTINSKSVSFSKEDNGLAADSLLSFLSGRVKAKNKETGNQVRLSEICKGSRHLVKASPKEITSNGSLSSPTPFWIHEHTADIIPRNEDCRRTGLNRAHLLDPSFGASASLVTYITDLRAQDVGRPVTIETYELGWMPVIVGRKKDPLVDDGVQMCQYILVRNDTTNDTCPDDFISPLQTVLLCGPSKNVLCDMEERFWNSICRLKNALCCGRVLPGAGVPEIACIRRLTEQHESAKVSRPLSGWLEGGMEHLRPLVYAAFAEGFKEFLASVITNSGHFTSLHGVSTHVEYLIKEGLSLNSHGSIGTKTFESTHNQPGVLADVTREHTDLSSRETTQNFPENLNHNVTFEDKSREVETLVWDNYTAKKEAWKRAVGIVRVLLQTDMLVQTGLNAAENEAELL